MDNIINIELLSLVLDEEVNSFELEESHCRDSEELYIKAKGNECGYGETEYSFQVNLDTLGRLCKEWCLTKEWMICSNINGKDYSGEGIGFASLQDFEYEYDCDKLQFSANTELEAIIKATKWVAKEKGLLSE